MLRQSNLLGIELRQRHPLSSFDSSIVHGYQYLMNEIDSNHGFQSLIPRKEDSKNIGRDPITENFSSLLIANLLGHNQCANAIRDQLIPIIRSQNHDGIFHFLRNSHKVPADIHSTCLGLEFLLEYSDLPHTEASSALEKMIGNTNEQDVIELYLGTKTAGYEGAIDPVACLNALFLLNLIGRSEEAEGTYQFVQNFLISRRYLAGTLHYPSPDSFLFFFTRLVTNFPFLKLQWAFELKRAVQERLDSRSNALNLAMQVSMATQLGIPCTEQARYLKSLQASDGSWPEVILLMDGYDQALLGSKALTTAFSLYALENLE